jgi:N-terminal half of MaoC dehydratase
MTDTETRSTEWPAAWQPVVDLVGQEVGEDTIAWGADAVELTGIRRMLEPFEFDCALHYDKAVAVEHGYADVIAPVSAIRVFAIPAVWSPGEDPVFPDPDRNAQPLRWGQGGGVPGAPKTSAAFMTDVEWDFLLPVTLGDRLGLRTRRRIVSCTPKQIRVGKGAFVTMEQAVVNQRQEVVMLVRSTSFSYDPAPKE